VQFEEKMKIWQTRIHVGAIFLSKALFFSGGERRRRIMMVWLVGWGEFQTTTLDLLFPRQIRINMAFFAFFAWHLILHLVQQQTQILEGHGFQDRIF